MSQVKLLIEMNKNNLRRINKIEEKLETSRSQKDVRLATALSIHLEETGNQFHEIEDRKSQKVNSNDQEFNQNVNKLRLKMGQNFLSSSQKDPIPENRTKYSGIYPDTSFNHKQI